MKHGRILSQDEINELPEGTEVVVTWSGGNGPHRYRTVVHDGVRCADNVYEDPLTHCGEYPSTEVSLYEEPER